MNSLIVTLHLILGALIVLMDVLQNRGKGITFLRAFNAVFFLIFVLTPIYVQTVGLPTLMNVTGLFYSRPLSDQYYVYAALYCALGYISVNGGYHMFAMRGAGQRTRDAIVQGMPVKRSLAFAAIGLTIVGLASLVLFVQELGGMDRFWATILFKRTGNLMDLTPNAFLISLAPLTLAGATLFQVLWLYEKSGDKRAIYATAFGATALLASVVQVYSAGRLQFLMTISVFPIIYLMSRGKSLLLPTLIAIPIATVFIASGRDFFLAFNPEIRPSGDVFSYSTFEVVDRTAAEFSFPIMTLANTIEYVPEKAEYRYFEDVPLAILYLVPTSYRPFSLPDTLAQINTDLTPGATGGVPVDLVSYGIYNGGLLGLFITCSLFGILLKYSDRRLAAANDPLVMALRVSWLMGLAFYTAYANPVNFVRDFFYLFVLTVVLAIIPSRGGLRGRRSAEVSSQATAA